MLTKNEIKYYSSLLQKKYRKEENKFIAEGKRLVEEGFLSGTRAELAAVTHEFAESGDPLLKTIDKKRIRLEILNRQEFEKLSDVESPQGIAAVFSVPEAKPLSSSNIYVALENISDPGNLGTIFRTCDWFGVKDVILSSNCVEPWNPKVLRSSMGAVFHLNIIEDEKFYDTLEKMKSRGAGILTADLDGENVYDFELNKKSVIVFSNEAAGPSMELISLSSKKITIPKFGKAESLNVAVSSAVILSEVVRKARH
jgi:TrmH family RNA methyltransferase